MLQCSKNAASQNKPSIALTQIAQIGFSGLNAAYYWLADYVAQEMSNIRTGLARRDIYRQQYCALQSQSDAALAESGISRCDIQALAVRRAMSANIR